MATPRAQQIDLSLTPYYHCVARCVRRAFLSGYDKETNKDFSHRKQWILDRIKYLSNVFFINICAYAIMSNHYHLVLHVDTNSANNANLDELLCRWQLIFPADASKLKKILETAEDKVKLNSLLTQKLQRRLSDISWYMRCMNEIIAKMANKEENCTGRFWEGRFKSQALLDEGALLSAMVYVDLNPIRAKMSITPEQSDFTSIQERIRHYVYCNPADGYFSDKQQPQDLMPLINKNLNANYTRETIPFYLEDYLELVDITGRIVREDKKGYIPSSLKSLFDRLQLSTEGWFKMVSGIESNFYYAVGSVKHLKEFHSKLYLRRPASIEFVKHCYQEIAA